MMRGFNAAESDTSIDHWLSNAIIVIVSNSTNETRLGDEIHIKMPKEDYRVRFTKEIRRERTATVEILERIR